MGSGGDALIKPIDGFFVSGITMTGGNDDTLLQKQLYTGPVALFGGQGHHAEKVLSFLQEQTDLFQGGFFYELFYVGALLYRVEIRTFQMYAEESFSAGCPVLASDFQAFYELFDRVGGQCDQKLRTSALEAIFIYCIQRFCGHFGREELAIS